MLCFLMKNPKILITSSLQVNPWIQMSEKRIDQSLAKKVQPKQLKKQIGFILLACIHLLGKSNIFEGLKEKKSHKDQPPGLNKSQSYQRINVFY